VKKVGKAQKEADEELVKELMNFFQNLFIKKDGVISMPSFSFL